MTISKTTIVEFTHQESSGFVAIVGNRHYGSVPYMNELDARLIQYQEAGAAVHYEGVFASTDSEIADFSTIQKRNYLALNCLVRMSDRMEVHASFVSIGTIMGSSSDWEHHDVSMTDIVKRATIRQTIALGAIHSLLKFIEASDVDGSFYKDMAEGINDNKPDSRPNRIGNAIMNTTKPLIVDYRNTVALNAVDASHSQNPSQSIALLWGNGHVPGLSKGLEARGYQQSFSEELDPLM